MPYNFGDNWLYDARPPSSSGPAGRRRSRRSPTCTASTTPHAVRVPRVRPEPGDTALRRHVAHTRAWYDVVARGWRARRRWSSGLRLARASTGRRRRVGRRCCRWGDARIGNVHLPRLRAGRRCSTGRWRGSGRASSTSPGWSSRTGCSRSSPRCSSCPACRTSCAADDVSRATTRRTGYKPRDLDFYRRYAAVQWGIVFLRTGRRQVHFGEREMPADLDELIVQPRSLCSACSLDVGGRDVDAGAAGRVPGPPGAALDRATSATSDRNFYDRCYFNAHDRDRRRLPRHRTRRVPEPRRHRRLRDGARGDHSGRCASPTRSTTTGSTSGSGRYRIEVVEPLQRLRLVCDGDDHGLGFDLTWDGSFPAVEEERTTSCARAPGRSSTPAVRAGGHVERRAARRRRRRSRSSPTVGRHAATGRGASGRSARPSRRARRRRSRLEGFWWLYVPLRFDDFAIVRDRAGGRPTASAR